MRQINPFPRSRKMVVWRCVCVSVCSFVDIVANNNSGQFWF